MLFPTVEFGIFFIIVFSISWLIWKKQFSRKLFLTSASYFFYGYWDWRFTFLLFSVSLFSYFCGLLFGATEDNKKRKSILILSVSGNLTVLGFFKYYGFFASSFASLAHSLGFKLSIPFLEIILPVGISFYTFQAMSYVFDVYRKKIQPSKSLLDVLFYISFFPQLIAGPIIRASHFFPQLTFRSAQVKIMAPRAGLLIVGGLFKKVIISNYIAVELVDPVFENPLYYSSVDALFAVYGYAVQIFCDFSAYSDIAIGVASLLGFHFPDNFNQPYRARSIRDFWRRWHISLSSWLRDYLYIPLGGSRKGRINTYRNIAITMFLGGLWHGAAWKFVFWGALHGTGLAIERYISETFKHPIKTLFGRIAGVFITFHFVCFGWIFFRANTFEFALELIQAIFSFNFSSRLLTPFLLLLISIGMTINFLPKNMELSLRQYFSKIPAVVQGIIIGLLLVVISAMGTEGIAPFIYFQF